MIESECPSCGDPFRSRDGSVCCEFCQVWEHKCHSPRVCHDNTYNRLPARAFGIELECYLNNAVSFHFFDALPFWGSCEDSSLESDDGVEIVSPALAGDDGARQVEIACELLNSGKCGEVWVNDKCGFHLHLDGRDLGWYDLLLFARLWMRVQPWTQSVLPASRFSAVPGSLSAKGGGTWPAWTLAELDACMSEKDFEALVYSTSCVRTMSRRKNNKYDRARYCQLNLHSWFYRETLEIRCHSGTTDAAKVLAWIELWTRALDWCDLHNSVEAVDAINDGYDLMRQIGAEHLSTYFQERQKRFN